MANAPRNRKRVFADFRRAPDGSAFQKCACCGVSVAVALADMHTCEVKVKKPKPRFPLQETQICQTNKLEEQPRSAFLFFKENYAKTCESENVVDIDRRACIIWKNMSMQERFPYILQEKEIDEAYAKTLLLEDNEILQDDDEADSRDAFKRKRALRL